MISNKNVLFSANLIVFALLIFLIHFFNKTPVKIFTISYIASSAIFIIISFLVLKYAFDKKLIIAAVIVGFLLRASFLTTMPIGSDDVFRYMWDGKVQSYGINPYKYIPTDSNLIALHSDILPDKINFPTLKTIYFPLSQWLFYIGYSLSGEYVWGYKLLLFIFEILTAITLFLILKSIRKPPKLVLLYILCPLPIIHFSLDSHLDGYGLLFIALSILFYLEKKLSFSMIFLGFSLSIKPIGLLLLPVLFFRENKIADILKIIFIPLITFFIQFIPYIFSSNPFESLFVFAKHWSFNGSIFSLINSFIKNNQTSRIICGILFITSLIPLFLSKYDYIKKFYYSVLLLLIFSPVVHPWYISWLTVLLPIIPAWSGIIYSSLSSLTAFTVLSYQMHNLWKEYATVLVIEYIPVLFFMLIEFGLIRKIGVVKIIEKKINKV